MPKFRFLIIIYRAFLLKADVPGIDLNRSLDNNGSLDFIFLLKERGFSSCLINVR